MPKTIHTENCPVCQRADIKPYLRCRDNFATGEQFEIDICNACGFAFTQDFPAEAEIGRYYESPEYISHTDTQKGIINRLYHLAREMALKSKSKLVQKYTASDKGSLLDVGCGTGYFLHTMKEAGWKVDGIEQSAEVRQVVKEKFGIEPYPSEYLFDIPAASYDAITMWHVLEHMEHLDKVMQSLHNILKDDGTIFIALPNKVSRDAEHYKADWAAYDVPRHLWHFSPDDFKLLANKHNFELKAIKPMYLDAFYIAMLSEKNKKTPLASLIGLMAGNVFFVRSLIHKKKASSLVYILKKQR
ncbi:class I SAM-dependent methyltransferase [Dysgonomonas sp. 25]|uniref:class I SAM-dependent methyltransferase n=1 Tax=Dysgonomonas sp. 25 TaxID=2302933 RepID=UPI0013D7AAE0|nr:class I SAM-dependent methyltransferase [Dysgonomonas sp. 25]NDV69674.1 class I SAM-dependent methyltransferase [Dysgonomonas sp. 25]